VNYIFVAVGKLYNHILVTTGKLSPILQCCRNGNIFAWK